MYLLIYKRISKKKGIKYTWNSNSDGWVYNFLITNRILYNYTKSWIWMVFFFREYSVNIACPLSNMKWGHGFANSATHLILLEVERSIIIGLLIISILNNNHVKMLLFFLLPVAFIFTPKFKN